MARAVNHRQLGLRGVAWLVCASTALALCAGRSLAGTLDYVCSTSDVYADEDIIHQPVASDPPDLPYPLNGTFPQRCSNTFGSVSSAITKDESGFFTSTAQSVISVDPVTGVRFYGSAAVAFNDVELNAENRRAATSGSFGDEITITAPGVSGIAYLSIPIHVTGSVTAAGVYVGDPGVRHLADFSYRIYSSTCFGSVVCPSGGFGISTTGETLGGGGAGGGAVGVVPEDFDQVVVVKVPFTLGQTFQLSPSFSVEASIWLPFVPGAPTLGGLAAADFSHTVLFGPASVLDADGNPIPDATIESDLDYFSGAVPEPSSSLLVAAAAAVLTLARKRREVPP